MLILLCKLQEPWNDDGGFISDFDKEPGEDTNADDVEYDGQLVRAAGLFVMKTRDSRRVTQVRMTLCAVWARDYPSQAL